MMKRKVKIKILAILISFLILSFGCFELALAVSPLASFTTRAIVWSLSKVAFAIGWLGGVVISLENFLLQWVLEANFSLMDSVILKSGWLIVRDIANLGFALGILIISIATIIGYEEYHARRLLVRLIIAALLINFSLMFCGIFVDFAGSFMHYFAASWGGADQLGTMLQTAVQAPKIFQGASLGDLKEIAVPKANQAQGSNLGVVLGSFGGIIFSVIFTLILVIVYGALVCLFLVRYGALLFLMILSPLAWIFWFLPGYEGGAPGGIWQRWWQEFLKWVFFGPIMLFFVFLALNVLNPGWLSSSEMRSAAHLSGAVEQSKILGLVGLKKQSFGLAWLIQYAVVITILLGGMKIALASADYVGGWFYGKARGVVNLPSWTAKKAGLTFIKRVGPPIAERGGAEMAEKLTPKEKEGRLKRGFRWLGRTLGGAYLAKKGLELGQARREEVFKKAQEFQYLPVKNLERYLALGNPFEKASALVALVRHRGIWLPQYGKYKDYLKRFGISESLVASRVFLEDPKLKSLALKIEEAKGTPEEAKLRVKLAQAMKYFFDRMGPAGAKQQFWSDLIRFEEDFKEANPAFSHLYEAFYKNLPRLSGPIFSEICKALPATAISKLRDELEKNLKILGGEKPAEYGAWLRKENPSLETYLRSHAAQNLGMKIELP